MIVMRMTLIRRSRLLVVSREGMWLLWGLLRLWVLLCRVFWGGSRSACVGFRSVLLLARSYLVVTGVADYI